MNMNLTKTVSQFGVESELLAQHLEKVEMTGSTSYEEMNAAAGVNVLRHRYVLNRVRKTLLREKQVVFEPVRGVGLRRLSDDEIAAQGIKTTKRIGRTARRGIVTVSAGNYSNMSPSAKVQQAVGLTIMNLIQHATSSRTMKKIEAPVADKSGRLPLDATLKELA